MKIDMKIVAAEDVHAAAICDLVRRSIVELCREDHRDDPNVIARWLHGKTPERVRAWIANPTNHVIIAVEADQLIGVGCIRADGEITLNYVSPEARFSGVSSAIVAALEDWARAAGHIRIVLDSTTTASGFYHDRGYGPRQEQTTKFGLATWPMIKKLKQ